MTCEDVLRGSVEFVAPTDRLQTAAVRMREANVGFLPVCDGDRVVGVITDRDLVVLGLAAGLSLDTHVSEVMTREVVSCAVDDEVDDAARLMAEHQIERVVVLGLQDELRGVISLVDLPEHADDAEVAQTLKRVAERDSARPE